MSPSKRSQKNLFESELLELEPVPWEAAAAADVAAAQVVLNRPLDTVYSYLVPEKLRGVVGAGQRVKIPFGRGNRDEVGFCVGLGPPPPQTSRKLKYVQSVLDSEPIVSAKMLELTNWIAERYLCGWGQVLQVVVPAGVKKNAGTRLINFFQPAPGAVQTLSNTKLPAKQQAVMNVLIGSGEPVTIEELTQAADCGTGPINALRNKGLIQAIRRRTLSFEDTASPIQSETDLELNTDQRAAYDTIVGQLRSQTYRTLLLHGVTGSGKTEVYIQSIREVVSYGRQAIVLVPEISLTPQTIRRFRSRFDSVAVLHSHLSDAERHWQWQQISRGAVQVIVGARSAVFAPAPHLGLIVIDEEHETTFKQESVPRYHAREVARRRAEIENIPLILGTATPTLESWIRVQPERPAGVNDQLISLPKRVGNRPLPPVVVVDTRNDPHVSRGQAIGRALRSSMQLALKDDGQVILFLNLRGFSPTVWCRSCGEGIKCPECDIALTWHKDRKAVLCHFCEFQAPPPSNCPRCNTPGLRFLGMGTQRLEDEVRAKFPGDKCLRMDSDSMRKPGSHDEALESFRHGDVRILLGTQMIAKGLDFPNVTLVGVIDADTMLYQPDLRAAERTFQLIAQVAGRTGRSERGGRVVVQSSNPSEPAIVCASRHDYLAFVTRELQHRRKMSAPPFRHLARVILRGRVEPTVRESAKQLAELLVRPIESEKLPIRILGPAPAPILKLKNLYRYHLQIAANSVDEIRSLWKPVTEAALRLPGVEFIIDVDPVNMR